MRRLEALERCVGEVSVPGDKSGSHRALLLAALADGRSTIEGLSPGEDVAATAAIVRALGARVESSPERTEVTGPPGGLRAAAGPLWCGNSGTTMRLVAGMVAGVAGRHTLVGDPSLSRRPMDRVATPLRLMGAGVSGEGERVTAPLVVEGRDDLVGIDYTVPIPSAQVKSAILLAGLSAHGHTTVSEAVRTRATTEEMLVASGITVHTSDQGEGRRVVLTPGRPRAHQWRVPGDPSQAAFFCVLGAIHHEATVSVASMDDSPERIGFVAVLQRMGARLRLEPLERGVRASVVSSPLTGTEVHAREIPSVDEVPALSVAAAAAEGLSVFREVGELRIKESDRLAGCVELVNGLGARAWVRDDDLYVEGLGSAAAFRDFTYDPGLDHRMVMAAAVAAVCGRGATLTSYETVATSYPHFFDDLASLA